MRRIEIIGLLLLVTGCGKDAPQPPPQPVAPVVDVAEVTPNHWIDEHFAPGWFATAEELIVFAEEQAGVTAFGGATASGDSRFPGEEVNLDPTGEQDFDRDVPADSRDAGDLGPPRSTDAGLGGREDEYAEEDEEMPRFGAAFEGVPEEEEPASTWQRSSQTANASRLMVGDEDSLPLESFQATVRIDGHRARVVLDYCYRNTFDFDAEGVFKLRLPDDAAVHYLAFGDVVAEAPLLLDVPARGPLPLAAAALTAARGGGSVHREARIVPREKAQQVYAAETAQAVDPALLEWNGAGVFTTRVYPLLSESTSRITVAYDVDLHDTGDRATLDVVVPADAKTSRVTVDDGATPDARKTWETGASQVVRVDMGARAVTAIVGDDPTIGPHFAVRLTPSLPATPETVRNRAIFVVDASMSSNPDRMNVWLDLLRATLERNRDDLTEFGVLLFNVETWWWRERLAPNEPETVDALMNDLARIALEGATDIGAALSEATSPSWTTADLGTDIFLLSDGAETWGAATLGDVAARLRSPVFCYTTGLPGTDTRALQDLARQTGGAVFSIDGAGDVAAAAVAHRTRPWTLRDVRVPGAEDVVVAGRPASVFPGQRLRIAGRGRPTKGDSVVLTLEQGSEKIEISLRLDRVVDSDLAPRAYGEIATGVLESLGDVTAAEARAYALHYGVTGETCSLLMLESEEVYLEYGIVRTAYADTVRTRPVAAVISSLSELADRARRDAREAFLVWLDRLEQLAGDAGFRELDELRDAAAALPVSAFEVQVPSLSCKTRTWDDLTSGFQRLMRRADPGYGATWLEAEGRFAVRGASDALRAVSSLVEADPGSVDLQRDIAFAALDWDRPGAAYGLLRRVIDARPFEPEAYRTMAECLERTGNVDLALLVHELALRGSWNQRFGAFPLVAAMDYRGLLRRIERGEVSTRLTALADAARERIASDFVSGDPDLVVTMTWNTDRTDVDLHVVDPAKEVCKYDHPRTELGGAMTEDVTGGYGPEMFVLGRAVPGEYSVKAHYYGSDALRKTLRSRVFVTITRWCGTPQEHRERRAFLLEETDDIADVMTFTWE